MRLARLPGYRRELGFCQLVEEVDRLLALALLRTNVNHDFDCISDAPSCAVKQALADLGRLLAIAGSFPIVEERTEEDASLGSFHQFKGLPGPGNGLIQLPVLCERQCVSADGVRVLRVELDRSLEILLRARIV